MVTQICNYLLTVKLLAKLILTLTTLITLQVNYEFDLFIISDPKDYELAETIMKTLEDELEDLEEPGKKRIYSCRHVIRDCSPGEIRNDW